jgi:hypothetical protein
MGCANSLIPAGDVLDIIAKKGGSDKTPDIVSYTYFPAYGRGSKLAFMMDKANVKFEFKPISVPAWVTMEKPKYGGMPFCVRSDGSLMKETDPIGRYICRFCDLYPTVPIDAYWNDYIIQWYQKFFNLVHLSLLTFGSESKKARAASLATVLPEWLEKMKPYYKEGWVVGNG